jgi:hypothetical protein
MKQPATLESHLAVLFPAPVALLLPSVEGGDGDWLWIQGRQDRVHRIVSEVASLERRIDANWTWWIGQDSDLARADALAVGLLVAAPTGLRIARRAVPNPGIFLRSHRHAATAWRALSSF